MFTSSKNKCDRNKSSKNKCDNNKINKLKSTQTRKQIYVAGPFFNIGERCAQDMIARELENAGYSVFLPQRDGLSVENLINNLGTNVNSNASNNASNNLNNKCKNRHKNNVTNTNITMDQKATTASKEVFDFDIYQIWKSDGVVSNGDGSESDSGTVSETAIAASMGKAVVIFRSDTRTFTTLTDLNPLYSNLATVPVVTTVKDIPSAMANALKVTLGEQVPFKNLCKPFQNSIISGRKIRRHNQADIIKQT